MMKVQTIHGEVEIRKDHYMGGWRIWLSGVGIRFTEDRFQTRKEALAYLERFAE
jgi:hypothetical protein